MTRPTPQRRSAATQASPAARRSERLSKASTQLPPFPALQGLVRNAKQSVPSLKPPRIQKLKNGVCNTLLGHAKSKSKAESQPVKDEDQDRSKATRSLKKAILSDFAPINNRHIQGEVGLHFDRVQKTESKPCHQAIEATITFEGATEQVDVGSIVMHVIDKTKEYWIEDLLQLKPRGNLRCASEALQSLPKEEDGSVLEVFGPKVVDALDTNLVVYVEMLELTQECQGMGIGSVAMEILHYGLLPMHFGVTRPYTILFQAVMLEKPENQGLGRAVVQERLVKFYKGLGYGIFFEDGDGDAKYTIMGRKVEPEEDD